MKVGAYVQPYDFFPIVKTLALHGAKFIPDVETHSIHPTVKSLSFDIETWVILTYSSKWLYSKIIVLVSAPVSLRVSS